ncbi:MAG: hypothetical protein WEB63_09020 [Cucumibacter sp.]
MNLVKFALAGAFMLALVACHEPGHEWCDTDDDGDRDGICVGLVVGAGAALKLIAFSAMSEPVDDNID